MQNELTCNQVIALFSFYVEDKINQRLKTYIDDHLRKCSKCRELYMQSKKIAAHVLELGNIIEEVPYQTKQYEDFKNNISSYVDNELDEIESIRIKKIVISNPMARKDLEDMYTFKRLLHNSFEKTKSEWKNDYSRFVINKLDKSIYHENSNSFFKLILAFIALFFIIVLSFLAILNF